MRAAVIARRMSSGATPISFALSASEISPPQHVSMPYSLSTAIDAGTRRMISLIEREASVVMSTYPEMLAAQRKPSVRSVVVGVSVARTAARRNTA